MIDDEIAFLNCPDRPFMYTAQQTAWRLNIPVTSISILMREGLLIPFGRPSQNGPKFFYRDEVEALGKDRKSLEAIAECRQKYWREKNQRKTKKKDPPPEDFPEDWSI